MNIITSILFFVPRDQVKQENKKGSVCVNVFSHRGNPRVSKEAELSRPRFWIVIKTKIICGGLSVNSDYDNIDDDNDNNCIPCQYWEKVEATETQKDTKTSSISSDISNCNFFCTNDEPMQYPTTLAEYVTTDWTVVDCKYLKKNKHNCAINGKCTTEKLYVKLPYILTIA